MLYDVYDIAQLNDTSAEVFNCKLICVTCILCSTYNCHDFLNA